MRVTMLIVAVVLSVQVVCFAEGPASTQAATTAATTQPTTQPTTALMSALYQAVEVAQQKVRTPPPPAPPPRNSFEKSRVPEPPDVLGPIADALVGERGLVAFRVLDVYDGHATVVPAPPGVANLRGKAKYVILGECDNPTATHFTDEQQRELRRLKARGLEEAVRRGRESAENRKPKHRVWILSDDDRTAKWARGSRQHIKGEVVSATLGRTLNNYVGAVMVLTTQEER